MIFFGPRAYGAKHRCATSRAAAFANGYFLSPRQLIGNDATLLLSVTNVGLVPGASSTIPSLDVHIPAGTAPGDYWIGFKVDHRNEVAELVEFNNTITTRLIVIGTLP